MFELKNTIVKDCFELQPKVFHDIRGSFVKIFSKQLFENHGLETVYAEDYYSISSKNVVRGLHFQMPPMDHVKLVFCLQGEVLDVVTDLRMGSPTYGRSAVTELSSVKANGIYVPKGMAHGFYSLCDHSIMVYKVSSVYVPSLDTGILWNSIGVEWPTTKPILSARDSTFESLDNFVSPFNYE